MTNELLSIKNELERQGIFLGKRISAQNGDVWTLKRSPNRLIKILVDCDISESKNKKIQKFFNFLQNSKNKSCVKIYKHGIVEYLNRQNDYVKCLYYVMEKLKPLPLYIRREDGGELLPIIEDYHFSSRRVPDFLSKKLQSFIIESRKLKRKYSDFHAWNIMLDKKDNYKFIDLESFFEADSF